MDKINKAGQGTGKSKFITVLALFYIIFSGYLSFKLILIPILMFSAGMLLVIIGNFKSQGYAWYFFVETLLPFLVCLALSILLLISSFGLLKRRHWARKLFIATVVPQLIVFIFLQIAGYLAPRGAVLPLPPPALIAVRIALFGAFLLLILHRLLSERVGREFSA